VNRRNFIEDDEWLETTATWRRQRGAEWTSERIFHRLRNSHREGEPMHPLADSAGEIQPVAATVAPRVEP
jgi:hypothetical protein